MKKKEDLSMKMNGRKVIVSGMLVALSVSLSGFSIPIGAARCFPIQHLANVVAAVFLGPVYGMGMAFCTSLIRNLMGTGSLLAFPGSMIGAFLGAYLYRHTGKLIAAYLGEAVGTGLLGGLFCYPIATLLMGKEAAIFAYVLPFTMSTLCGTIMAAVLLSALYKSGAFHSLNQMLKQG